MIDQASCSSLKLSNKFIQSIYLIAHEKLPNAIHFVTQHYVIKQKMCECQLMQER